MQRFILCDPSRNHYKFWEITDPIAQNPSPRGPWRVWCRWGRIGTTGQRRDFFFHTQQAADLFRLKKIRSKQAKGYQPDPAYRSGSGGEVTLRSGTGSLYGTGSITFHPGAATPPSMLPVVTHTIGSPEPHTVGAPSTEREILASGNKALKQAYLESLPPLDPEDPFGLPFDD